MAHGNIHWSELMTNDVDAAKTFYSTTAGWEFDDVPMHNFTYTVCKVGEAPVAGIMPIASMEQDGVSPHWMTYVEVSDVDAVVDKVETSGGKVLTPPFDVPNVGRIAVLADHDGAVVGMMTPA
ncbi:MAG: VOC family protein [Pseudomonadota bacterium]